MFKNGKGPAPDPVAADTSWQCQECINIRGKSAKFKSDTGAQNHWLKAHPSITYNFNRHTRCIFRHHLMGINPRMFAFPPVADAAAAPVQQSCPHCPGVIFFTKEQFEQHRFAFHLGWHCKMCSTEHMMSNYDDLYLHVNQQHRDSLEKVVCETCHIIYLKYIYEANPHYACKSLSSYYKQCTHAQHKIRPWGTSVAETAHSVKKTLRFNT